MPTGVSHLYYPIQSDPSCPLECDDSYFRLKIHDAQVIYPTNVLNQARSLLLSSSVENISGNDSPTQGLYKFSALEGSPCRLGVNTNLTDWLPARQTDTLRITLKYTVMQTTPLKTLLDKMEGLDLEGTVSLIQPNLAVPIKISQIVGRLLSLFLPEDKEKDIFPLTTDINLANLKAGYHAALGSHTNEGYPTNLEIRNGVLSILGGRELSRHSYVVIQVQAIKRRGLESVRGEPWGDLLQECKDEALNTTICNDDDRTDAFQQWQISLRLVRAMARKDHSFLAHEIRAVIAEAQEEVEQKLFPKTTPELKGLETYPDEWRQILGFSTPQELQGAVRDYQDAVAFSEQLLREYQLSGSGN